MTGCEIYCQSILIRECVYIVQVVHVTNNMLLEIRQCFSVYFLYYIFFFFQLKHEMIDLNPETKKLKLDRSRSNTPETKQSS